MNVHITSEAIIDTMNSRYAGKIFDPTKKVSEENLRTILEAGRLSPSSYGVEPWHFIVVDNKELRTKLRAISYDQPKITDASHVIVLATRTDVTTTIDEHLARVATNQGKTVADMQDFGAMIHGRATALGAKAQDWFIAQSYIPLGIMVETAALLGVDSCPMEGFDPVQVNDLLGLTSKNLHATTILTLGYRGEDPYATMKKTRKSYEEAITVL